MKDRDFATRLRAELKAVGITQSAMARALGLPTSTVSCWMTGTSTPRPRKRKEIEAFFEAGAVCPPAGAGECMPEITYPVRTTVGVAWAEPVKVRNVDCRNCPHFAACRRSVAAGDFALCEAMIDVDLDPGNEARIERTDYHADPGGGIEPEVDLVLAKEVTARLGICAEMVRTWARRGKVRSVRGRRRGTGYERWVNVAEVERYARERGLVR